MNLADTGDLIARVKVGDNREVDDLGLLITDWYEAIGHLDLADCLEAVRIHRGTSKEYLGTAHIAAGVKLIVARRERAQRVVESFARRALPAPVNNLDRAKFDADTQSALEDARRSRGLDPATGKPTVKL